MCEAGAAGQTEKLNPDTIYGCTNQQPPQRGGAVPDPVWVGSKWLLDFPRVSVTPDTFLHFSLGCPLNDRRRAAHSFFKIGRLSSLLSCFSLACPRPFILLLLLMTDNVHPNSRPIFSCSVCAKMCPRGASQGNAIPTSNGSI